MNEEQDILNNYASGSLMYTADQDYIAARMSYRAGLIEPFLWSSLHAIEKYLKALLLFNKKKVIGFRHDIVKLLNDAKEIDGLDLRIPAQVESFISYINEFGENRYFEGATRLEEYALDNLDETIWYIRRYCYDRKAYEGYNLREIEPSYFEENPKTYKLSGFLENVIKEKSCAYLYLAWNNCFYGEEECERDSVRKSQSKISAVNPTLAYFGQQAFDVLSQYADLSLPTKQYFRK